MSEPVLDVEVVQEETGLEPVTPPANLFHTNDPLKVVEHATAAADALKGVLSSQNLTTNIQGREHVRVEGWLTLGAMLGVTPVCTWTKPLVDPDGWEARVEARTLDGRTIGAAEAECLRTESSWKSRDDYALRSMAQTRATSKALASVLRFVVTLAGYSGTPAEEMPSEGTRQSGADVPSGKQLNFLGTLLSRQKVAPHDVDLVKAWGAGNLTGGKEGTCSRSIDALTGDDADKRDEAISYLVSKAKAWSLAEADADPITPEFEA